jgi:predicted phage terminase large subunit-like protein
MQRPSPMDGGLIKKTWFKIVGKSEVPNCTVNFYLYPAYTAKQSNDPTGAMAYINDGNNLWILTSTSVWKEFPELCAWLPEWVKENGYTNASRIRVEPKASGKSIVQQIKATTGLNVIEDEPPKDDKVTRVNSASPKMEAGRIYIVSGSWNESFLNQLAAFPNGQHDDEVDCLTAAIMNELNKPKFIPIVG